MSTAPLVIVNPNALYVFVGYPGHGKTTARNYFCQFTGLKGGSCSDVIIDLYTSLTGWTKEEVLADKAQVRPVLVSLGDFLCGDGSNLALLTKDGGAKAVHPPFERGPAALSMQLYEAGVRAIDGVRRASEMVALKSEMEKRGVPVFVVHVRKPHGVAPADNTDPEVFRSAAWGINNGHGLLDLQRDVYRMAQWCSKFLDLHFRWEEQRKA
jgi:hypothetical protein